MKYGLSYNCSLIKPGGGADLGGCNDGVITLNAVSDDKDKLIAFMDSAYAYSESEELYPDYIGAEVEVISIYGEVLGVFSKRDDPEAVVAVLFESPDIAVLI
jgi:hypothetical protein